MLMKSICCHVYSTGCFIWETHTHQELNIYKYMLETTDKYKLPANFFEAKLACYHFASYTSQMNLLFLQIYPHLVQFT